MSKKYSHKAKVWKYPSDTAWYFTNLDRKASEKIKEAHGKGKRGFGSIKVQVSLGKSKWKTSLFPDSNSGTYVLPLKAAIRRAEEIDEGDTIRFTLVI